ncbi:MAG: helix-turn-helix transcriptional regulator [Lachnospiraceae bacterium]|nr:helix-turn-helix transcriptional regulator [Lachnospiraceae bacterium]
MPLPKEYKLQELIAKKIREYADEYGLSYSELSQITGIPKSTLTSFMSGAHKGLRIETVAKLANGFDMTLKEFFDDDRFDMIDMEDLLDLRRNIN